MGNNGPVLEEVLKVLLTLAQRSLYGLAVGNVLEADEGAEKAALVVVQRIYIDQEDAAASIGALDNDLTPMYWLPGRAEWPPRG